MDPAETGDRGRTDRLFGGWFGRLVLPGVVLQSVLIGGGYATGREIVAYGARFGPRGWPALLAIFAGFTLMAALTFEVARVFRVYDYKSFIRQVIGRLWPAFDLLYGVMVVLVIAIMASAAANIMERTLGVPNLAGTALIVVAVGVLTYHGARVIEAFKSVGTLLLYGAYLLFGALVLGERWGELAGMTTAVVAGTGSAGTGASGPLAPVGSGVLYVGYNLAVFPAVLFTLRRQRSRRETLAAALVAGLLMTLPFVLTYLCLLTFYPSPEVFDAPVPWLPMLRSVGGPAVVLVFGAVMGWTLLETSVGLIHALVERIDEDLKARAGPERAEPGGEEAPGRGPDEGKASSAGLSPAQSGLLAAGLLAAAAGLSRIGIIALVAKGYTVMGYLFIALFAVPLLTVGVWKLARRG